MKFLLFMILILTRLSHAQMSYRVYVPEHESYFAKELIAQMRLVSKGQIQVEELPVQRAILSIISGKGDLYYPILKPLTNVRKKFDYDLSTVTVSSVIYAVYVNKKNKDIKLHNLQNYVIEGENGHTDFFDFKVHSSSCIRCSFLKVDQGRIDGYIYPAVWGDEIIKVMNLKNIESYYFDTYELKFALPKRDKNIDSDKALSEMIQLIKKNGSYDRIFKKMNDANKNWKPLREYF